MTSRKYKMYYDYKKRTRGGFLDMIFLLSIMMTGLIMLLLSVKGLRW